MSTSKSSATNHVFPEFIRHLPEVATNLAGVQGFLAQSSQSQTVFFDIAAGVMIPPHSHCAQWGLVVEGQLALTIDGHKKIYTQGQRYFIAEGSLHSAEFLTRVNVIDVFDDPNRYQIKT